MIKFLDLQKINSQYKKELKEAAERVIDSGWYLLGKELENFEDEFYVHPIYFAIIYLALDNREEALISLEKGFEDRSEWMIFLQVEHMLDPLRGDKRFMDLVNRMNFD